MNRGHEVLGRKVPAQVQALAARNLQLLQAIENTVSVLSSDVKIIFSIAAGFAEIHSMLSGNPSESAIDPDGVVCGALAKASDASARMHRAAKAKHQAACTDHQLHSDDGVADAYADYLAAIENVHDCIEALKEWIATHDAALEADLPGTFADVDALFAAMGIAHN